MLDGRQRFSFRLRMTWGREQSADATYRWRKDFSVNTSCLLDESPDSALNVSNAMGQRPSEET